MCGLNMSAFKHRSHIVIQQCSATQFDHFPKVNTNRWNSSRHLICSRDRALPAQRHQHHASRLCTRHGMACQNAVAAATAAATLDCDTTSDMTSMRWVAATNDLSPTHHTSAAARSAARTTQPSMQQQQPYAGRRLVVAKDQLTTSLLMRPYRNCLSQHNAVAIVKQ